jgi:DNA (cytosine-5)-methyltransferase 1
VNHLDLFTGIMGFSLAAHWAGWKTVAVSEIDSYCCELIKLRMPGVPNLGDIKNYKEWEIEQPIDVITGGYPCQGESIAGKRRGTGDDRWLWYETLGIIKKFKPIIFMGENVAGHVSLGLDEVCASLEDAGYEVQPVIIPACAVNGWHRRDRVWILAHSKSKRLPKIREVQTLNPSESCNKEREQLKQFQFIVTRNYYVQLQKGSLSKLCREDNVLPEELDRLKGLGNAIVPQIAYEIMLAINRSRNDTRI